MPYYYTCPLCGANLDPGEKCDCTLTLTPPPKNQNENKEDNTNVGNQSNNRSTRDSRCY